MFASRSVSASKAEVVLVLIWDTVRFFPNVYFCQWKGRKKRIGEAWCGWNSLKWPRRHNMPCSRVAKVTRNWSALDRFGKPLVGIFLLHKSREEWALPCSFLGFLLAPQKALGQEQNRLSKRSCEDLHKTWLVDEPSPLMTGLTHRMCCSQDTSRARTGRKSCRIHPPKAVENCLGFYSGEI